MYFHPLQMQQGIITKNFRTKNFQTIKHKFKSTDVKNKTSLIDFIFQAFILIQWNVSSTIRFCTVKLS